MTKSTWLYLFILVFILSCSSKEKYNGTIILSWDNKAPRQEDAKVIENRLKKIGIKKYTIEILSDTEIKIDAKNVGDTSRLIELLMNNAVLSFWETYENDEAFPLLDNLDQRLSAGTDHIIFEMDSLLNMNQKDSVEHANRILEHPLWSRLHCNVQTDGRNQTSLYPGAAVGMAVAKDTATIDSMLRIGYRLCLPADMVLRWSLLPQGDSIFMLVALKKSPGTSNGFMDHSMISDSEMDETNDGHISLNIQFNEEGTKLWKKITQANIGRCIAIALGDKVISYPMVQAAITEGEVSITGPDVEGLEIIQQASQMLPFKTKPIRIAHHFEKKK